MQRKKRNRHYPPDPPSLTPPEIGLVAGGCVTRTGGGSSIYTVSTQYLKYLHSILSIYQESTSIYLSRIYLGLADWTLHGDTLVAARRAQIL